MPISSSRCELSSVLKMKLKLHIAGLVVLTELVRLKVSRQYGRKERRKIEIDEFSSCRKIKKKFPRLKPTFLQHKCSALLRVSLIFDLTFVKRKKQRKVEHHTVFDVFQFRVNKRKIYRQPKRHARKTD